jgi:hypothetical protein
MKLFKHFTDVSQGVRRLGAASVDLCHVAMGMVDAYWEYRLKPWDVAAGVCFPAATLQCACSQPASACGLRQRHATHSHAYSAMGGRWGF